MIIVSYLMSLFGFAHNMRLLGYISITNFRFVTFEMPNYTTQSFRVVKFIMSKFILPKLNVMSLSSI